MDVKISMVGNTWVKMMNFPRKGETLEGHKHRFDHQTLVAAGAVHLTIDGVSKGRITAPSIIEIRKGSIHSFTTKENKTVLYCIHALHKTEDPDDIFTPDELPTLRNAVGLLE